MATRTTRSKKAKPAEAQDSSFMAAFRELGVEKGINPEILFDAIEAALVAAYKRNFNAAQNVRVTLDRTSGQYHVYAIKTVVEEVQDNIQEISLAMAQQISPNYQLDDTLEVEVTPANFGRIDLTTNCSFFEVPEADAMRVLQKMKRVKVGVTPSDPDFGS